MDTEKRALPEMSIDTQVLIKRLTQVAVGEVVTYDELSKLIGRDVRNGARGFLNTARHRLKRDDRAIFAIVRKVGVKRLDDFGIVKAGESGMQHIRNQTRRVVQTLGCVADYENLPNDVKRAYNLTTAQAGMLAHITKPSTVKKIEARVSGMADTVPAKFLEAVKETL